MLCQSKKSEYRYATISSISLSLQRYDHAGIVRTTKETQHRSSTSSRTDRSPYPRRTLPSLHGFVSNEPDLLVCERGVANIPSSFFSSSFASAGASPDAPPAAAPDGAAAAPPPDPTFNSMSLTSFPSSACAFVSPWSLLVLRQETVRLFTLAKRVVHIGSTSSRLAALMRVCSLSA